ncbi:MAG: hypothetical protein U0802_18740 [Candidatus Binatia bacterium]
MAARSLVVDPADPRRAWAATNRGLHDDRRWPLAALPLGSYVVAALALDPRGPVLYASGLRGDHGYVIRSDDGGESWGPRVPVFFETVNALAVDARDPDTVYTADGYRSVATSRDGGVTWRVADVGGLLRGALAVDPRRAGRVYAAGVGGVFRSDDFGATWTLRATPGNSAFPVAVDGNVPDVVFTSAYEGTLLRSRDAGQNLGAVRHRSAPAPRSPRSRRSGQRHLVRRHRARTVRSDDGGATWTATALDPHQIHHLAVVGSTVYAAIGGAGIARSDDGGASWERASAGLGQASAPSPSAPTARSTSPPAACSATATAVAPGRCRRVALRDSGVTALAPHPTRVPPRSTPALAAASTLACRRRRRHLAPGRPRLRAGALQLRARGPRPGHRPGRTRTPLGGDLGRASTAAATGETWIRDGHRLRNERLAHIALDPRRSGTVWVAGEGPCGLLPSRDGGASWQRLCRRDAGSAALAVDPRRPDALYAGWRTRNWRQQGLYRSTDGGRHWTLLLNQPADARHRPAPRAASSRRDGAISSAPTTPATPGTPSPPDSSAPTSTASPTRRGSRA